MGYIGSGPTKFNTADGLTVTGNAEITGATTTAGMTTSANVNFDDNVAARFGAGNDLTINHDGSNSFITDSGTGSLYIQGTTGVFIRSADGGENLAAFTDDGAATLYYDNAAKIATTATGVDVTGIITTDGVESTCAAGDSNQALLAYHPTSTSSRTIAKFQSNVGSTQSNKVVILCDGKMGIGTDAPASVLDIKSSGATSTALRVLKSSATQNLYAMTEISGHGRVSVFDSSENEDIRLDTNGVSFFNGGTMLIGKTSAQVAGDGVVLYTDGVYSFTTSVTSTGPLGYFYNEGSTANGFRYASFRLGAFAEVGTITTNGSSSVSYNTSSDYRLKNNVTYDWDATTRLKQLKPARFNFIVDADTTVDGFLAHEVSSIVPEAITGNKDAMMDEEYEVSAATGDIYTPATDDADEVIHSANVENPDTLEEGQQWRETKEAVMGTRSVPNYQGIDQSKLVPLLCKTILELEARITALENA